MLVVKLRLDEPNTVPSRLRLTWMKVVLMLKRIKMTQVRMVMMKKNLWQRISIGCSAGNVHLLSLLHLHTIL